MTMKITPKQEVDIINAFTIDLVPMIELAKRYDMTRQGVWKALKRNGVSPSDYGRITITCPACDKEFSRHRCQVRDRLRLFCSRECYFAHIEASQGGNYEYNRHGQRIARAKVAEYFDLKEQHIVHHEDRNTLNNIPDNLRVFRNQGDHIRYHRLKGTGLEPEPIWSGGGIF